MTSILSRFRLASHSRRIESALSDLPICRSGPQMRAHFVKMYGRFFTPTPAPCDLAMTRPPQILALVLIAALPGRAAADRPVTYERDVLPILTRAGCNAGACHGKARGQNGFQLSLLGFDRDFDYNALT